MEAYHSLTVNHLNRMYACYTNLFVVLSIIDAPQIALWEEYSCKLETQVHVLTGENDTLQKRLAAVQGSLADGGTCPPPYALHLQTIPTFSC